MIGADRKPFAQRVTQPSAMAAGGILLVAALTGCGGETTDPASAEEPAQKITVENMDEYMHELEAEISAEEAAIEREEAEGRR